MELFLSPHPPSRHIADCKPGLQITKLIIYVGPGQWRFRVRFGWGHDKARAFNFLKLIVVALVLERVGQ